MPNLAVTAIVDLTNSTKKDFGTGKVTDISSAIRKFWAMPELMKKSRLTFQGGSQLQFNLLTDDNDQAAAAGLWDSRTYNQTDATITGTVDWRMWHTKWAFDVREKQLNSAKEYQVLDLIRLRRYQALVALAEKMERWFWTKPTDSTDTTTPHGVEMYLVENSSEGFNGGNPSGFTSGAASINSSTYTRWANWSNQYTSVTIDDLVFKLRRAIVETKFIPPASDDQVRKGSDYGLYTNYTVLRQLEDLLDDRNENMGNDLAEHDGKVHIGSLPVNEVHFLHNDQYPGGDSNNPVRGINWANLKMAFVEGWYMKQGDARNLSDQPHVVATDIDFMGNLYCDNRRTQFTVATA